MHPDGSFARGRRRRGRGLAAAAAVAGLSVAIMIPAGPHAARARAAVVSAAVGDQHSAPPVVKVGGAAAHLTQVRTVNLAALASSQRAGRRAPNRGEAVSAKHPRTFAAPLRLPAVAAGGAGPGVAGVTVTGKWAGNVAGAHGFNGLSSRASGALNAGSGGLGYVSPPDPALAVGPGPQGVAVLEFVNDALGFYSPRGKALLPPVPAYKFFGLKRGALLSDPRAYVGGHWFATESVTVRGPKAADSAIYLAVSRTTDPLGRWAIYRLDTADSADTADGCPCFDNFAQLGVNGASLYVTADQYAAADSHFTGTVIYDVKVYGLYVSGKPFSAPPPVRAYVVPAASDSFGAYGLSPAQTVPGSSGNIAEYFVESSTTAPTGSGLRIYALINPNSSSGWPQLVDATVSTEPYSFPAHATQRRGPTPYGCSIRQCATPTLDSNFDTVQQAMFAPGLLYAELDTGIQAGAGQRTGAAWFVLDISPHSGSVAASLVSDGYLATTANILDPVIAVSAAGRGYLAFAVANSHRYPSAAYVAFNEPGGPASPIRLAAKGASPLDDFTCYASSSPGQCRFGDYSAAVYWGHRIYMATEYTASGRRDSVSNWSTRIWSAPVP
jgi:hypothetical protein